MEGNPLLLTFDAPAGLGAAAAGVLFTEMVAEELTLAAAAGTAIGLFITLNTFSI